VLDCEGFRVSNSRSPWTVAASRSHRRSHNSSARGRLSAMHAAHGRNDQCPGRGDEQDQDRNEVGHGADLSTQPMLRGYASGCRNCGSRRQRRSHTTIHTSLATSQPTRACLSWAQSAPHGAACHEISSFGGPTGSQPGRGGKSRSVQSCTGGDDDDDDDDDEGGEEVTEDGDDVRVSALETVVPASDAFLDDRSCWSPGLITRSSQPGLPKGAWGRHMRDRSS
jgi:hypothetical protein